MKKYLFMALGLLAAVMMQGQVSFTASEWASAQSLSDGAAVTSYTSGDVTVTFAQGTSASAPSWNSSQSAVAAVSGNTMTISAADGKVVTQAVLTMYRDVQAANLAGATWNTGNASASGTTVTWTGEAEEVTVTINNTARFVSFSLTLTDAQEEEPPFVEDESKYNDTIEVSFAEWIDYEGFSNGEGIDGESYTKDGAQITVAKGTNRTAPEVVLDESSRLLFRNGNTLTVKAPYMMHKILLHFTSATHVGYFLNGRPDRDYPAASGTTGAFYADENVETNVLWLGSAAELTITFGYNNYVTGLTIIGDNTVTGATVNFLGLNGEELKSETVAFGGSATAPALPTTSEVGYIIRWDKDFSHVQGDLTVRAVKELAVHLDLTPAECDAIKVENTKNNYISFTSGGATIMLSGDRATDATNWAESEGNVVIFAGNTIAISATETFRTVRFTCLDADDAQRVGGSICTSGTISVSGNTATWKGATNSLTLTTTNWDNEVGVTRLEVLSSVAPTTVTFLDKDGNVLKTDTVKNGTATAPEAPAVTGYVFSGWSVPFTNVTEDITTQAQYSLDPNYVIVTFTDLTGNVIETQLVTKGSDVTAPAAPSVPFYEFTGWSAPLTNIQETQTIQAQYTFVFNPNDPNILTVAQAKALLSDDGKDKGRSDLVVVKGIVTYADSDAERVYDGKLSFKIDDVGYEREENLDVTDLLNIGQTPFTSPKQIMTLDTVYVVGYVAISKWVSLHFVDGYLAYILRATYSDDATFFNMPDGATLYDFDGNGVKEALIETALAKDIQKGFIEDVNRDGKPDIYQPAAYSPGGTWLSTGEGYEQQEKMLIVPNMDLNRDGRPDYLVLNQYGPNSYYGDIMYRLPDGTYQKKTMQVMDWDAFVAQMTPEEQDQYNNPQDYSLGDVSRYTYAGTLGGASLARAPKRNPSDPKKAPGIGSQINAPTKAIDLNGDELVDLIDEKTGIIYTNMDNGKWVWTQTNGAAIPADLNNDGITDFIFPGSKLYTAIFNKATNQLVTTMLYQNATVDNLVHCYDFDQDGDIDILATFSAAKNNTGYAYTCFFVNDGNGNFTQQPEQSYGSNDLWFSALQDVDGDGSYDLLAFRGDSEVVWLKGNAMQFAAPVSLGAVDLQWKNLADLTINAEDLNNDGKAEIWISGLNTGVTEFYPLPEATAVTANNRPSAPAAPVLSYDNGLLTISWGNGVDDKTATADLTYALRIGTTAGGNDILAAHANADGSRRNFIDGNMGKEHSYTINLRTYAPATVYVAVQAIDAQHSGSTWSTEAAVAHTYLPVEFTLDRSSININETVELTFTALPEGYSHTWTVQDGDYVPSAPSDQVPSTKLILSFTSGGEKTITHTITAPGGSTTSATATITVLPAGVGEALTINNDEREYIFDAPVADYNFDGRMDGIKRSSYSSGTYASMVVMEGVTTDQLFTQAAGLWNTNILSSSVQSDGASYIRWYDYNRDGMLDLLFREGNSWSPSYGILYHDATQPTLTARQDDDNLPYLFEFNQSSPNPEDQYSGNSFYSDMTHNGLYDNLMWNNAHYQLIELDGNGGTEWKQFTVTGDEELLQENIWHTSGRVLADFDHDGWTDIAFAGDGTTTDKYGNVLTYGSLSVFLNKGGAAFEQKTIPFAQELETNISYRCADLNGDGYLDLIVRPTSMSDAEQDYLAVLWNNANQSFSAPQKMPNSEALYYSYETLSNLADLDNNGYPDLVATVKNPAAGENHTGTYVWYMGAEGLLSHGFIIPDASEYGGSVQAVDIAAGDHRLLVNGTQLYPIVAQADERPAAPTGLQAQMTEEGLLITWNAAVDDHTPAALMRYNLAVKQQGAATWLISPQNGQNTTAAYLPDYDYIEATQFLIPTTYLRVGNYEIAIQALDRQNQLSLFTEAVVANVTRSPIEAPASACADKYVTVSYRGAETTGTPVWNWDGATVVEGSGFGPYTVYWPYDHQGGEKTITLTLNGETYTRTIAINDPSALDVVLPTVLYEGTAAAATVPEGVTYKWYALIDDYDEAYPVTASGVQLPSSAPAGGSAVLRLDYRLIANGLNVTAVRKAGDNGSLVGHEVTLYLEVTNDNGCSVRFAQPVTVMPSTDIPVITLVTTDANGHNVVSWTNVDAFATVNVYKEGNTLNEFQLIGSVAAADGSFTDALSDATQKAERYRITGVTAANAESPESRIHKTVYLTINRGVTNGTFNLIWNAYEGAAIGSYNILRGATPASLAQIASLAASNTSYTDQAPADSEPYYAIEYVLPSSQPSAISHQKAPAASLSGRSNVVDRRNAGQGIEDVQRDDVRCTKVIIDGVLYIVSPDGKIYNAQGALVK